MCHMTYNALMMFALTFSGPWSQSISCLFSNSEEKQYEASEATRRSRLVSPAMDPWTSKAVPAFGSTVSTAQGRGRNGKAQDRAGSPLLPS